MEHTNKELFKVSKKVFQESIFHQQMESAGSNKAKLLERVGKNRSSLMGQSIAMKCLIALYIVIFTYVPVISFLQINIFTGIPGTVDTWNLFAGGLSVSAFLLLQPIILIIFSVTFTWGFLSEGPYNWINTLPYSKKDISKIGFFTFLRGIDVQIIVLALVLPVGVAIGINLPKGMGIGGVNNVIVLLVTIVVNLANTIFNISVVILLGRKMATVMEGSEENNKTANVVRIGSMLAYIIFSMIASFAIQMAITKIPLLYNPVNQFISTNKVDIINKILCFIPFPFSGGYLLTSLVIGVERISNLVIIGSSIGVVLQIGIAILMLRKAIKTLQGITTIERKTYKKQESKKPTIMEVRVSKPVKAFMKRDWAVITREMQAITFMLMPIMIPIVTALGYALSMDMGKTGIPAMVLYIMMLAIFSTFFIVYGITGIENSGETITSSLPIKTRDQVKAKLPFLFSTVPLMVIIAVLLQLNKTNFMTILWMNLALLPAIFVIALVGLFLKVYFFGKLKYKFVVDEVNKKFTGIKLISIVVIMLGLATAFTFSLMVGYWLTLTLEGVCLVLLLIVFNFMFPKKSKAISS